jgi:glycosyltransferase involved in cell wall biosynthesis
MKNPLVTISIPTYNSAPFLKTCLDAIKKQSYKNIEINIVDGNSKDSTLQIAKEYKIKDIIIYEKALLGARYEGVKHAKGEFVLLLDSDQILESDAIERAVELSEKFNSVVFEETVYSDKTFIEKLFKYDRELINTVKDFSPFTGVMLPRFYKKSLLEKAFKNIPQKLLSDVGGQDHAIIYYEVWSIDNKVGYLTKAVKHMEPSSVRKIWKKFFRWGYTSNTAHHNKYDDLLKRKERFRSGMFKKGTFKASAGSILLLLFKGVPYKLGYYYGKILK